MKDSIDIVEQAELCVQKLHPDLNVKGEFKFEVFRKGVKISEKISPNTVTNEGRNKMLDITFHAGTAVSTWYIGLINGTSPSTSSSDTMTSHAGWAENTAYDESVRQTWVTNVVTSQTVTTTTAASFTINATGNIVGFFIASVNTKGASTGTLWSTSTFSSVPVVDDDVIKVTYTIICG